MERLLTLREEFEKDLYGVVEQPEPQQLYDPIRYILTLGGKRLRPVLTLMCCELFGGERSAAMPAALSVELFHNFSLIHDDIMDKAPLRRGKPTVHHKWDINTGILSGDAMLILAYRLFESYPPELFRDLAALFSQTALEVCEGQQYDMDFESRDDVAISEYLQMIDYKTAVLVGAAMKMGAMVAGASSTCAEGIYAFGRNLGVAFQLQDDYLDAFGDPKLFGKQVGGDIIANKKTYLYLKALELADPGEAETLRHLFSIQPPDPEDKIAAVKEIMEESGAAAHTLKAVEDYTAKAYELLDTIQLNNEAKGAFREFGEWLMRRAY